jgi:hypothetical protein
MEAVPMAIATAPISPLYRVQTDPAARFQRFGANDSQLFGKPLLKAPEGRPSQTQATTVRAATEKNQPQGTAEVKQGLAQNQPQPIVPTVQKSFGYSGRGETSSNAKLSTVLDLIA